MSRPDPLRDIIAPNSYENRGNEGQELDIYARSVICAGNQELLQDAHPVILEGL
jgi:hypothetical protein